MALNFKRHTSLTADELISMKNGGTIGSGDNREPVDKTAWYKAPEGLEQFKTPNQEIVVRFDVLEFQLTNKIHKDFVDAGCWDATGKYYWNYNVCVHECFPKTIVCNKTYDFKKSAYDAVCTTLWDQKDIYDYRDFNKRYVVMLLRVHPNKELGIDDYKFMYYIDTPGKLMKAIEEAYDKANKRKDFSKLSFFNWYEDGCSIEAFFSELKAPNGIKFWGCNDITFIPREKPLTEQDCEMLEHIDMCAGVPHPTNEEYAEFMEYFVKKAPKKNGISAETTVATPEVEQPPFQTNTQVSKSTDPTFANSADDEDWAN